MSKKIILIGIIGFIACLTIPAAKAEAVWTYVGVKVELTENSGGQPFCLPKDTTIMYIYDGATLLAQSAWAAVDVCEGSTMWTTSPVNLTDGHAYIAKIRTGSGCPGGYVDADGHCWRAAEQNQSCTDFCADKGGPLSNCCESASEQVFTNLGLDCGGNVYPWCPACYYDEEWEWTECYGCQYQDWCNCDWSNWSSIRLCVCKSFRDYSFNFTAPI